MITYLFVFIVCFIVVLIPYVATVLLMDEEFDIVEVIGLTIIFFLFFV